DHALRIAIVLLAQIVEGLVARRPAQVPSAGPGRRVRTRIVHRCLVTELIEVRTREPFREMELTRVRHAFTRDPEPLVEPDGVDDQRVAFPVPDRVSVPARLQIL